MKAQRHRQNANAEQIVELLHDAGELAGQDGLIADLVLERVVIGFGLGQLPFEVGYRLVQFADPSRRPSMVTKASTVWAASPCRGRSSVGVVVPWSVMSRHASYALGLAAEMG